MITDVLIIEGYEDPALVGKNITFNCREGLMLIGPSSVTCMGNGEWEPNPKDAICTGGGPTGLVTTEASTLVLYKYSCVQNESQWIHVHVNNCKSYAFETAYS